MSEAKKRAQTPEERREYGMPDVLAEEQPTVLDSAADDPVFPAMSEFEIDEGGPEGSKDKHPGLLWAVLAAVAVIVLIFAFVYAGDWY